MRDRVSEYIYIKERVRKSKRQSEEESERQSESEKESERQSERESPISPKCNPLRSVVGLCYNASHSQTC